MVGSECWTDFFRAAVTPTNFPTPVADEARDPLWPQNWRRGSDVGHRSGTPHRCGVRHLYRRSPKKRRRNIADGRLLPKPTFLRTVDAPGRRLEGRAMWAWKGADSRPAGRKGIQGTDSACPAGALRHTPRRCPVWQIDLSTAAMTACQTARASLDPAEVDHWASLRASPRRPTEQDNGTAGNGET